MFKDNVPGKNVDSLMFNDNGTQNTRKAQKFTDLL